MNLTDFKNEHQILDVIKFDNQIHRYQKPHQKSKASWYIGFEHFDKGISYKTLVVGDYTMGDERFIWKSYEDDKKIDFNVQEKIKQLQEIEEQKKRKENAKAASTAQQIITQAMQCFEHNDYFERKKITSSLGTYRYKPKKGEPRTIVPMVNEEGKITSIQSIYDDGSKRFLKGGAIKGSYHLVGDESKTLYICEGFATAASIHYATGKQVAVCFMASNIESVALIFKDKRDIIICADDDKHHDPTKAANSGLKTASMVYQKHGIACVYPKFKDETTKPTDFNDLHLLEGLEAVKNQVEAKDKSVCEFLGYDDAGYYFYSNRSKMIKCYSLNQLKQGALIEMASEIYWATQYYPKSVKDCDLCDWPRTVGKIIEQQQKIGKFKIDKVKGIGSWIDKKDHIIHTGDKLLVNFKPMQISDYKGSNFYYPAGELRLDWEKERFDFSDLIKACNLIDFKTEADRMAFIGFIAQSAIFTTQRWRSNIWINAPKGSGKSVLLEFLSELCINSLFVQDTTAAGIRQSAKYDSKTVLYDEAEGEQHKTKQVLEMARTCSSSGGSQVLRGSVAGRSIINSNDFLFCFSSIRQPNFTTADESRITTIRLSGNEDRDAIDSITKGKEREKAMLRAVELGPDVFVYLNKHFKEFKDIRKQVIEKFLILGLTQRQADQLSGILSGYILLSGDGIEKAVETYFLSAKKEIEDQETDTENLLNTFKDVMVRHNNEEMPLGIMMYEVERFKQEKLNDGEEVAKFLEYNRTLNKFGITYLKRLDAFGIKNNIELKRVFGQKTDFKNICRSLKTVEGVDYGVAKFNGKSVKCVKVPYNLLFN